MLGGGGVRKDSFLTFPSPSNACHAGYFLSAKRHKGSLWQSVLTIHFSFTTQQTEHIMNNKVYFACFGRAPEYNK